MKKIKVLFLGIMLGLLIGCGSTALADFKFTEESSYHIIRIGWGNTIIDYVDDVTGVHYLVGIDTNESITSICQRYNADGSLYVKK